MPRPARSRRTVHVPVMLHEVLEQLDITPGLTILDGTVGAGGHSQHILKRMNDQGHLIGVDRDQTMLDRAAKALSGPTVSLHQASYAEAERILDDLGIEQVDRVLLDLGLSSDQLADQNRGFGFDTSGPLDMRFDVSQGVSARELLSQSTQAELVEIFKSYGDEKHAEVIATAIVHRNKEQTSIQTADELVELIESTVGTSGQRKSPSVVRVFQALRIAVNREIEQLQTFLDQILPQRLKGGGRVVIITFHSLEDRMVKEAFRDSSIWSNLTRKPLAPTPSEIRNNPRSRSAKIRVAERVAGT